METSNTIKATTIQDVAQAAGVSITTVSRALNNYPDVSDKTKQRILKKVEELDYRPNVAARTLSSKSHNKVAMIINNLELNRLQIFPFEIMSSIYHEAKKHDIETYLLFTTSEEQRQISLKTFIVENNITGAIIQGLKLDDPYFRQLNQVNLPTVLIDIGENEKNIRRVSIDNITASYEAVSYLIEQGHSNIGMISGHPTAFVAQEREAGYIRALNTKGISFNAEYIRYGLFDKDIAKKEAICLLKSYPEITALFCASDVMALGVLDALKELGLKCPDDISIIGFDDIVVADFIEPKLTTVRQYAESTGRLAIQEIINMKSNHPVTENKYAPHELIVRSSVRSWKG